MFSYYFSTVWLPTSQKNSKPSLCTSRTQTRKSFRLSSHNTSLLRLPLLLYRTRPLSFHGKSPGRISVSGIPTLPTGAHSENWQLLCLSTWRFTQASRSIFPFFQKGILRTAELCSRKPTVIITLFTYATSIGNNTRCPGRIPFYGFESVSGNRRHNPRMGKCAVSPEDYHISDFGICIFCKSVSQIRAVHIRIVL